MKQLHIMLLFTLTSCSEVYKIGINGGNLEGIPIRQVVDECVEGISMRQAVDENFKEVLTNQVVDEHLDGTSREQVVYGSLDEISIGQAVDAAPQPDVNHVSQTFMLSSSRSISFVQKGRIWVATVEENLSPFIRKSEALPVYFEEGFSLPILSNYQSERQKNLIHIMPNGHHIVYVGRLGLPGGAPIYSSTIANTETTPDDQIFTFIRRTGICTREEKQSYKCFHCKYFFSSSNKKQFNERLSMHRCHKGQCRKCLETNQCKCDIGRQKKYCKECCDCKHVEPEV